MTVIDQDGLDILSSDGKKLEDAFFKDRDKTLIEKQKAVKSLGEMRASLAEASGIRNETVLQALVERDVKPETLVPLQLIPLIRVAWADGSVSKKEEALILAEAHVLGIRKENVSSYECLQGWLRNRPSRAMSDAWAHYIRGRYETMGAGEKDAVKKKVLEGALRIAEASGGVLGVGAVSSEEKKVLSEIEAAFS